MKKIIFVLFGITTVLLVACGAPAASNNNPEAYVAPNESVNSASSSSEIFIPDGKGNAPNGIMDQITWVRGGGGLPPKPCGNCEAKEDGNNLSLSNFKPYQNLLLMFYRQGNNNSCGGTTAEFVTSIQVQVDGSGSLYVPMSGTTDGVIVNTVLDADTGFMEIENRWYLAPECISANPVNSCPGAPAQMVQSGESAYVCTLYDRLIVRLQPSTSGNEITRLEKGTQFNIIGGPECSDNMSWWKIDVNGTTGWVAEGRDQVDTYFICPTQ